MPDWLVAVLGLAGAGVVCLLCYELITGGTKQQKSGCAWIIILAVGCGIFVLGAAILLGVASVLSTSWGQWILVAVFLAMGYFGFFYKPKK